MDVFIYFSFGGFKAGLLKARQIKNSILETISANL